MRGGWGRFPVTTPAADLPAYQPAPPLAPHIETSDALLAAAAAILERPDEEIDGELRVQACDKLWGAVSRRLRAFADARGWYYCEHSQVVPIAYQIDRAVDADPPEILSLVQNALDLHVNFYDDLLEPAVIRWAQIGVRRVCAMLDDAHRDLPRDLAAPNDRGYLRAARRCAEKRARGQSADAE